MTEQIITDPAELASLNAVLLQGLTRYLKQFHQDTNVQQQKDSSRPVFTVEELTKQLDQLLAQAEGARLDRFRLLDLLESRCTAIRLRAATSYAAVTTLHDGRGRQI